MKKVLVYTDGACSGNPGVGGVGIVLLYMRHRKEISQGYRWTTNNRMELMALITALSALKEPCQVEVTSDSKYVLDAFGNGWISNWKKSGWRTASKRPVSNRDLWEILDKLVARHSPTFVWVKGHAQSQENIVCDKLAVAATKAANLLIDRVYEGSSPLVVKSKD